MRLAILRGGPVRPPPLLRAAGRDCQHHRVETGAANGVRWPDIGVPEPVSR